MTDAKPTSDPPEDLAGGLASDLSAAYAWWREAGVDCAYLDAPRDWLAPPPGSTPPPAPDPAQSRVVPTAPAPTRFGGDPSRWPRDLAGFADWWLGEPELGVAPDQPRLAPRGAAKAALMVLVPQPEPGDRERLLSGPQGRLLAGMLAALGLAEEQVYLASALPAQVPLADWATLAQQGIAAATAHHISLVAPRRLLLVGRESASALLGNDPPHGAPFRPYFHHDPWQLQVACVPSLEGLLERPARKAGVWRTLLDWGS